MRRLIVPLVAAIAAVLVPAGMGTAAPAPADAPATAPTPMPADSAAAGVSADLPVTDGTVLYVRYGEPGAVRILRRNVTGDSLSLARDAAAEASPIPATASTASTAAEAAARPGAGPVTTPAAPGSVPADLVARVREILREELRVSAGAAPAPGAAPGGAPGAASGPRPGWLDSSVGSGMPLGSPAPGGQESGREWTITTPGRGADGGMAVAPEAAPGTAPDGPPESGGTTALSVTPGSPLPTRATVTESMMKDGLFRTNVILFETLRAELLPRSREVLDVVAGVLSDFPDVRIRVEGHADARGDETANLELSRRRAEEVRRYLTDERGIRADRLDAAGYGESRPLESGTSETALALNRRVEFHVLNPEALRRVSGPAPPSERNDP